MPALHLFGRRWLVASDDIPAPAFLLALFRVLWCGLLTGWLISIHGPRECVGAWQYNVAAGGLLGFFLLSLAMELAVCIVGMRGSLFETSKRAALPKLLYADAAAFVGQIAFNGYCTALLYHEPPRCEVEPGQLWRPKNVLLGLVWSTWAVQAGCIIGLALVYNMFPDYKSVRSWEARWSLWATCCFCCLSSAERKRREALAERLGRIFSLMFGHIDMTASDIVTAFLLAMTVQKIRRRSGGRAAVAGGPPEDCAEERVGAQGPSPRPSPSCSEPLVGGRRTSSRGGGEFALTLMAQRLAGRSAPAVASTGDSDSEAGSDDDDAHGAANPSSPERLPGSDGPQDRLKREAHHRDPEDGCEEAADVESGSGKRHVRHESRSETVDAETLDEAAHFMTYAFAAYGYLLYIWGKPGTGVLDLCCGRNCGLAMDMLRPSRKAKLPDFRVTANLNREATLRAAGLAPADLVFVRYQSEVPNVLPYFIALDHATQTVVLSIRGSLSFDDVVRDLLIEPADLDQWTEGNREWHQPIPEVEMAGPSTKSSGHAGIVEAARATLLDLQARGWLGASEHLWKVLLAPNAQCKGWKLVVTGHSLGAGCAFLIALYLRNGICPGVRCWAFSPPGGLASAPLGDAARAWCTTIVCGREWIPRLSARSFDRLRDDMVSTALRCRLPKLAFMAGVLRGRAWAEAELVRPEVAGDDCLAVQEEYLSSLARGRDIAGHFYQHSADYTVPGRILHLKSIGSASKRRLRAQKQRPSLLLKLLRPGKRTGHEYRAIWISQRELQDEGIILSGRMMADHMPDHLLALLRKMARRLHHSHSTAAVDDRAGESVLPRTGGSSVEHRD